VDLTRYGLDKTPCDFASRSFISPSTVVSGLRPTQ